MKKFYIGWCFILLIWLVIAMPLIQMKYNLIKKPTLTGVVEKVNRPVFTIGDWNSGTFQHKFEDWFNQNFGLREYYIKTNKQLYYSVFNQTPYKDNITIGKEKQLYETGYVNEYLGFIPPMDMKLLEEKVKDIKMLQDLLHEQGKTFLLLLTPSKASIYPEFLPNKLLSQKNNLARNYDNIKPLLDKYKIQYIDGHSITESEKKSSGYDMFPRGGTHWNYLGAYYTTKALVEKIENLTGKSLIDFNLNKIELLEPKGTDRDLADLLNLWIPPINYTSPKPIISVDKNSGEFKPSILIEGGSFSNQIIDTLSNINMFRMLDFYFYYNSHNQYKMGEEAKYLGQISQVDWKNDVLNHDVIIVEMNEQYIAGKLNSNRIFYEDLLAQFTPENLRFPNVNTSLVEKTEVNGSKGFIIKKGVPAPGTVFLESGKMQLIPGKKYRLSYKASGFSKLNFDLFPDDLPQFNNDKITDSVTEFSFVFKSDNANIKSATARFFIDGLEKPTDKDLVIYDIKLTPES
ncbi:alginate O-acetyltransferase AlgX-related protein [Paenibacillus anseongense]|uniref:alginate O-acetyltransferase AlgX-related protein n=1 Tax=Paenibacillus anseongense TaxID=2682845 RepID=UPI002DBE58CD|nr:hypothetical protein [Paenibacillus anseongense]MEC0264325.1 hypothetical protein [Paenibacillus anseongense]